MKNNKENREKVWNNFIAQDALSALQSEQFSRYLVLLTEWNKKFNITTITDEPEIVRYHFQDSLRVGDAVDMGSIKAIADIGSGGGFPGIPLKIKYPDVFVVLIENNQKKIGFLEAVIKELGLTDIEVCPFDWRTFLRSTDYDIDLFVARASLQPADLIRVFSPAWGYDKAQLIYFATQAWEPIATVIAPPKAPVKRNPKQHKLMVQQKLKAQQKLMTQIEMNDKKLGLSTEAPEKEAPEKAFMVREFMYEVGSKKRKLVFFAANK